MKQTIKYYYSLTKPGVLYGNAITAWAGFLFATNQQFSLRLFLALAVGITLVIASACVLNNYLDQDIDQLMERTKNRAIVAGKVPGKNAVLLSIALGIIGLAVLYAYTNLLTTAVALFGFIVYVIFYGMLSKRLSVHGTLVGSVSGAAPILAGYTAAANTIDGAAVLLFLVLFFWQMPEFYSIAIYRRDEYKLANIPVITVKKGIAVAKKQILVYTAAFVISTVLLAALGYAGYSYLVVMTLLGLYWLQLAVAGLKTAEDNVWAKKMFKFSLIILLAFCLMISLDPFLL